MRALEASLGCGNPLMVAELNSGETVLDLGSGGGIDVLLSARRVGPTGKAYGLDMTDEMLDLARRNAAEAGATNVEFLRGHIEDIPLPADSVDVVISNCVINLSTDKPAVFASTLPGARRPAAGSASPTSWPTTISTPAERAERGDWVGCIAGALSYRRVRAGPGRSRLRRRRDHPDARGGRRHALRDHPGAEARRLAGVATLAPGVRPASG